jgi:restriction system protein
MARSFSRSLANAATSALMRAMKEAERDRKRIQRAEEREHEKQLREQAKARQKLEKERYLENRIQEASDQSDKLIRGLDKYNDIASNANNGVALIKFEDYQKEFNPREFKFSEPKPKDVPPKLQEVPKESWLDNIFSSRVVKHNNIIESNENEIKRVKEEYEQKVEYYNIEKKQKYEAWLTEEEIRREEVREKNQEVMKWEEDFYNCEEEAVLKHIKIAFNKNRLFGNTVKEIESGYNQHNKTAIIEIHIKSKADIFPHEGYKYFKTRDSIEPVKMKITAYTKRLKGLMLNIVISSFFIVFRNANSNNRIVEEVVVNVFHEGVCCISGKVAAEQFNKLDLNITSNYDALSDNYLRIMKQLTRGVKSFERIYVQLGLE